MGFEFSLTSLAWQDIYEKLQDHPWTHPQSDQVEVQLRDGNYLFADDAAQEAYGNLVAIDAQDGFQDGHIWDSYLGHPRLVHGMRFHVLARDPSRSYETLSNYLKQHELLSGITGTPRLISAERDSEEFEVLIQSAFYNGWTVKKLEMLRRSFLKVGATPFYFGTANDGGIASTFFPPAKWPQLGEKPYLHMLNLLNDPGDFSADLFVGDYIARHERFHGALSDYLNVRSGEERDGAVARYFQARITLQNIPPRVKEFVFQDHVYEMEETVLRLYLLQKADSQQLRSSLETEVRDTDRYLYQQFELTPSQKLMMLARSHVLAKALGMGLQAAHLRKKGIAQSAILLTPQSNFSDTLIAGSHGLGGLGEAAPGDSRNFEALVTILEHCGNALNDDREFPNPFLPHNP